MDLKTYFESTKGTGVLSTSDADGTVNTALYARPHMLDTGLVAMVMRDRRTRRNLRENPKAAYLFLEKGGGYAGRRLYLKMVGEEQETARLYALKRRRPDGGQDPEKDPVYLVFFELLEERPLAGDFMPEVRAAAG